MLTRYATPRSANGRKALTVCRQPELKPEIRLLNVRRGAGRRPECLAVHPSDKIAALVDGDFVLTESNAILQYLCETHGGCRLWSRAPEGRARIPQWLYRERGHWQPVLSVLPAAVGGHRLTPERVPAPAADVDWEHAHLRPTFATLEACLFSGH